MHLIVLGIEDRDLTPPLPALEVVQIRNPHHADFESLFRLYEEALPASERKPRSAVESLVGRADYHVLAWRQEGRVVAFLMLFTSGYEDIALLEYMATAPHLRGQGLGAQMFRQAVEIAGARPLLVEFDSDRAPEAPDRELRTRRKQFYLRLGCDIIENLDYRMPQVSSSAPPLMDLAYYWDKRLGPSDAAVIRNWLQTVYAEVYQRGRDDPAIDEMMGALEKGANSLSALMRDLPRRDEAAPSRTN